MKYIKDNELIGKIIREYLIKNGKIMDTLK